MYRQFVDRELALFEQLVTPLLRQRNPEARRQATRAAGQARDADRPHEALAAGAGAARLRPRRVRVAPLLVVVLAGAPWAASAQTLSPTGASGPSGPSGASPPTGASGASGPSGATPPAAAPEPPQGDGIGLPALDLAIPEPPQVSATGWVLYEPAEDAVLGGNAEDVGRPMASTTKIMTVLLALEARHDGRVGPEVLVSAHAVEVGASPGAATLDLVEGERTRMRSSWPR